MNRNKAEKIGRKWNLVLYGVIAAVFGLSTWVSYQARLINRPAAVSQPGLTVELKSDKPTVSAGEKFMISVYVSGTEAENLSAAQLNLNYNNGTVKLVNYEKGEFWKQGILLSTKMGADGINLAIGRGPNGSVSLDEPVTSFKFQVASAVNNPLQFSLSPDTQFAKLGGGSQPVKYSAGPLSVEIR